MVTLSKICMRLITPVTLVFALSITFGTGMLLAEKSDSVPAPSALEKSTAQLLRIEYDMAESQYLINRSVENKNKKILLLEKLVHFHCMRSLRFTLTYDGPPENELCDEYRQTLEKIQSDNLVAICAREGIDSEACATAFDHQYILPFSRSSSTEDSLELADLDARLYSLRSEKNLSDLRLLIEEENKNYKEAPQAANLDKLENHLRDYLQAACQYTQVKMTHSQPEETKKANFNPSKTLDTDPVGKLVKNFQKDLLERRKLDDKWTRSKSESSFQNRRARHRAASDAELDRADPFAKKPVLPEETEKEQAPQFRVRYLAYECFQAIDTVRNVQEKFPYLACHRESFISPRCIAGLRTYRERAKKRRAYLSRQQSGTQNSPKPGLATF